MKSSWKNIDAAFFKTPWNGWFFKDGLLWDDRGNHYTPNDIKLSWQAEAIINNKFGNSQDIHIMKDYLKTAKQPPESITIKWENVSISYKTELTKY